MPRQWREPLPVHEIAFNKVIGHEALPQRDKGFFAEGRN